MVWDLKKADAMFVYAHSTSSTSVAYNQPVAIPVEWLSSPSSTPDSGKSQGNPYLRRAISG